MYLGNMSPMVVYRYGLRRNLGGRSVGGKGGAVDARCCNIIMQRESCLLVTGPRGESEGTTPCSIACSTHARRSIDLRGQPGAGCDRPDRIEPLSLTPTARWPVSSNSTPRRRAALPPSYGRRKLNSLCCFFYIFLHSVFWSILVH